MVTRSPGRPTRTPREKVQGHLAAAILGRPLAIPALLALRAAGELTATQLSDAIGARPNSGRGVVNHLEQQKIVLVQRSGRGRQLVYSVRLSSYGAAVADAVAELVEALDRHFKRLDKS